MFQFQINPAEIFTQKNAIAQALGAASMCWDPPPEGVFDSEKAGAIVDALEGWIGEFDEPFLGLATTRELLQELIARWGFIASAQGHRMLVMRLKSELTQALLELGPHVLDYRTVDA